MTKEFRNEEATSLFLGRDNNADIKIAYHESCMDEYEKENAKDCYVEFKKKLRAHITEIGMTGHDPEAGLLLKWIEEH
jgi:hypothetical protein